MGATEGRRNGSETGNEETGPSSDVGGPVEGTEASAYYPENESMLRAELIVRYERFAELREQYLLGFGYQTARAYWGDLEHFHDWCLEHEVDMLGPTPGDIRCYLIELLAMHYSPNTVARRRTTLRAFYKVVIEEGLLDGNPVSKEVKPIPRRLSPRVPKARETAARRRIAGNPSDGNHGDGRSRDPRPLLLARMRR